jgi:hypothetical protein
MSKVKREDFQPNLYGYYQFLISLGNEEIAQEEDQKVFSEINRILINKKNDDLVMEIEEDQDKRIFAEMERLANETTEKE